MSEQSPTIDAEKLAIVPLDELDAVDLRSFLVTAQEKFWDDRNLIDEHDAFWFRQFASSGLAARYDGDTVGYLLGAIPRRGPAYIHLVAARNDYRHLGIGRRLYTAFIKNAKESGASHVQAATIPGNSQSIAFHSAMGFSGEIVESYAGPGEDRVFFDLSL